MKYMCRGCQSRRCLIETVLIDNFDMLEENVAPMEKCVFTMSMSGKNPVWEAVPKCG